MLVRVVTNVSPAADLSGVYPASRLVVAGIGFSSNLSLFTLFHFIKKIRRKKKVKEKLQRILLPQAIKDFILQCFDLQTFSSHNKGLMQTMVKMRANN